MNAISLTESLQFLQPRLECVLVVTARSLRNGIDCEFLIAGHQAIAAGRRQFPLQRIVEKDGQHLIVARNARQIRLRRPSKAREVTEYHDEASRPRHATQCRHRLGQGYFVVSVGGALAILPVRVIDQFMNVTQRRLTPKSRLELAVHRVAEDQTAEPIAAMMRRPRQQRRSSTGVDRFETPARCEMHAGPQINDDKHGTLALFPKLLAALEGRPKASVRGGTFTWCWCDALFMSPPVWVHLSEIKGDTRYLVWADREWWTCTDVVYDPEASL